VLFPPTIKQETKFQTRTPGTVTVDVRINLEVLIIKNLELNSSKRFPNSVCPIHITSMCDSRPQVIELPYIYKTDV